MKLDVCKNELDKFLNHSKHSLLISHKIYTEKCNILIYNTGNDRIRTASISCIRHDKTEGVELVVSISELKDTILFDANIYSTDGSFIKEINEKALPNNANIDDINKPLVDFLNYIYKEKLVVFSDIIEKYCLGK